MNICGEIFNKLLKALYPNKCMFCGDIIDEDNEMKTCRYCENELVYSENGNSVFYYSEIVKNCIHRFKYSNHPEYAPYIAKYMYIKALENGLNDCDIIVSVPMYRKKEKKRGFNQTALIAEELSKLTGIVHDRGILLRVRNTLPQSKTGADKKFENLKDAFKVENKERIRGKRVLLIDDIRTSGSTLKHCGDLLTLNGAEYVGYMTFAAARKNKDDKRAKNKGIDKERENV
ncbi:MAG: ComF family protein [Firmicutes bacterium]|nr:ComF family protein [Bacillota bacterium]